MMWYQLDVLICAILVLDPCVCPSLTSAHLRWKQKGKSITIPPQTSSRLTPPPPLPLYSSTPIPPLPPPPQPPKTPHTPKTPRVIPDDEIPIYFDPQFPPPLSLQPKSSKLQLVAEGQTQTPPNREPFPQFQYSSTDGFSVPPIRGLYTRPSQSTLKVPVVDDFALPGLLSDPAQLEIPFVDATAYANSAASLQCGAHNTFWLAERRDNKSVGWRQVFVELADLPYILRNLPHKIPDSAVHLPQQIYGSMLVPLSAHMFSDWQQQNSEWYALYGEGWVGPKTYRDVVQQVILFQMRSPHIGRSATQAGNMLYMWKTQDGVHHCARSGTSPHAPLKMMTRHSNVELTAMNTIIWVFVKEKE